MKIDLTAKKSRVNFGTAEKDLFSIVDKLLSNQELGKLLKYPTRDALSRPPLESEIALGMIHDNIRVIPDLPVKANQEGYIIVTFDNFTPNDNNPEFRDNYISFDVFCHTDIWVLDDSQLRPLKIMGCIDGMLEGEKLHGIGNTEFVSANQLMLGEGVSGYNLLYRVVNDI